MKAEQVAEWFEDEGELIRGELEYQHESYEISGNPLHIWAAYKLCHEYALPIPKYISSYLGGVYSTVG